MVSGFAFHEGFLKFGEKLIVGDCRQTLRPHCAEKSEGVRTKRKPCITLCYARLYKLAGQGFEPRLNGSEPFVLPLHHPAKNSLDILTQTPRKRQAGSDRISPQIHADLTNDIDFANNMTKSINHTAESG